jgi:serine/threonine protein kinase
MIEYLERLGSGGETEDWLVRFDGQIANAHIFAEPAYDHDWHLKVASQSRVWLDVRHPSLIPLLAIETSPKLVTVTGDERGPSLLRCAEKLTDLEERERWVVTELAGIADAVARLGAHDPGYVHRRVEHENMIVGEDGRARLRSPLAWVATSAMLRGYVGQARALTGGTLQWLSPELLTGRSVTPASDVFQLASTLYAGITLRRPFKGDNDFETLSAIKDRDPRPPLSTIPGLPELVMANLAKDPARRDPDLATFGAKLRALVPEAELTPYREGRPSLYEKVAMLRPDRRASPSESAGIIGKRCAKQWDELAATRAPGIRHCATCDNNVIQVRSIDALVPLLGKSCIAYDEDGD